MSLFGSSKAWSTQARTGSKNRKAAQQAKARRAAKQRADNRKHMIKHPASHLARSIFR